MICRRERLTMVRHALVGMVMRRAEWDAFVDRLVQPQWILAPA
jgi:hypothetical protein